MRHNLGKVVNVISLTDNICYKFHFQGHMAFNFNSFNTKLSAEYSSTWYLSKTPGLAKTCCIFLVPINWCPTGGHFTQRANSIVKRASHSWIRKKESTPLLIEERKKYYFVSQCLNNFVADCKQQNIDKVKWLWTILVGSVAVCMYGPAPDFRHALNIFIRTAWTYQ